MKDHLSRDERAMRLDPERAQFLDQLSLGTLNNTLTARHHRLLTQSESGGRRGRDRNALLREAVGRRPNFRATA